MGCSTPRLALWQGSSACRKNGRLPCRWRSVSGVYENGRARLMEVHPFVSCSHVGEVWKSAPLLRDVLDVETVCGQLSSRATPAPVFVGPHRAMMVPREAAGTTACKPHQYQHIKAKVLAYEGIRNNDPKKREILS